MEYTVFSNCVYGKEGKLVFEGKSNKAALAWVGRRNRDEWIAANPGKEYVSRKKRKRAKPVAAFAPTYVKTPVTAEAAPVTATDPATGASARETRPPVVATAAASVTEAKRPGFLSRLWDFLSFRWLKKD